MRVPEIIAVKDRLETLKKEGIISEWELPYENLLTRVTAAIFFLNLADNESEGLNKLENSLKEFGNFSVRGNSEMKLSRLKYRVTFSEEEKKKNAEILEGKVAS
jgi:hypothetical protein